MNNNRLLSLTLENYASFKDRETVTFDAKIPLYMVVGHNASGKTNLLRAIAFLKWLLLNSFKRSDDSKALPVKTFLFSKKTVDKPAILEVEYVSSNNQYKYHVELTSKRVLFEELQVRRLVKVKYAWLSLFRRKWDESVGKYRFDGSAFGLSNDLIRDISDVSGSLLAMTGQLNTHQATNEAIEFWKMISTNVLYRGKGNTSINDASKVYYSDPKLLREAVKLLRQFDLGLESVTIKKTENENKDEQSYYPVFVHSSKTGMGVLPYYFESEGTRSLYVLLLDIVPVLADGGLAVLDEIDNDLHPLMMERILDLFLEHNTNLHGSSLILASHNADYLRRLDKENIIFAEKDKDLSSHIWKLSDMKGIRRFDNYTAKYLSGSYGAVMREDEEE